MSSSFEARTAPTEDAQGATPEAGSRPSAKKNRDKFASRMSKRTASTRFATQHGYDSDEDEVSECGEGEDGHDMGVDDMLDFHGNTEAGDDDCTRCVSPPDGRGCFVEAMPANAERFKEILREEGWLEGINLAGCKDDNASFHGLSDDNHVAEVGEIVERALAEAHPVSRIRIRCLLSQAYDALSAEDGPKPPPGPAPARRLRCRMPGWPNEGRQQDAARCATPTSRRICASALQELRRLDEAPGLLGNGGERGGAANVDGRERFVDTTQDDAARFKEIMREEMLGGGFDIAGDEDTAAGSGEVSAGCGDDDLLFAEHVVAESLPPSQLFIRSLYSEDYEEVGARDPVAPPGPKPAAARPASRRMPGWPEAESQRAAIGESAGARRVNTAALQEELRRDYPEATPATVGGEPSSWLFARDQRRSLSCGSSWAPYAGAISKSLEHRRSFP